MRQVLDGDGDGGVFEQGKQTIVSRYVYKSFNYDYLAYIESNVVMFLVFVNLEQKRQLILAYKRWPLVDEVEMMCRNAVISVFSGQEMFLPPP
jgi:hypothetical protein